MIVPVTVLNHRIIRTELPQVPRDILFGQLSHVHGNNFDNMESQEAFLRLHGIRLKRWS
jgi:hypothetical protein